MFKFVKLGYTQDLNSQQGIDLAFIAAPILDGFSPERSVIVREVENWKALVDEADQEYVEAVLADFRTMPAPVLLEALDGLGNMFVGILRTNEVGTCRDDEITKLSAMPRMSATGTLRQQA